METREQPQPRPVDDEQAALTPAEAPAPAAEPAPHQSSEQPAAAPQTPVEAPAPEVETVAEAAADDDVSSEVGQAQDAPAAEDAPEAGEKPREERRHPEYASTEAVLNAARELSLKDAEEIQRGEVENLKHQYYDLRRKADADAAALFVEQGGKIEDFTPALDMTEEAFKEALAKIKEKKADLAARQEAEMQARYEKKEALIAELVTLSGDIDNVNRQFPRFREIVAEFKTIGDVPPQHMSEQWKRYQDSVEHFYDQLKVNKDLRDYDFKKNLDTKLHLCDEAEGLAKEEDTITAFRRLQELHIKWRETGPVAKEQREELWNRFREASAMVNKNYQAHFEERKAREQENEAAKTAICERVEAIDFATLNSFNDWNAMTRTILEAQEEWKKLGFASRKANNALFARFRNVCDKFFTLKGEYYRGVKQDLQANLERKTALCEQAEALMNSTDWRATADRLTELQKEWRTLGAVPKKHSDAIWRRFQNACDTFFEAKKKDLSQSRSAEQANLKAKQDVIAALRQVSPEASRDDVLAAINDARLRWNEIGHVPFREKDRVFEDFRAAINDLYKSHDLRQGRGSAQRYEERVNALSDKGGVRPERERLARVLETKRQELATVQNNLGFFNFKSAAGSSMLRDIERKTQRLRDDIADLEQKIAILDERI